MEEVQNPVLRAVRQLAASVFDSIEEADAWLATPNAALAGKTPEAAIATPAGHRAVVDELKRLDYSKRSESPSGV
jgi:uncharacterized protein (DUF2384 family)